MGATGDDVPDGPDSDPDATSIPWRSGVLHVVLASSLVGVMGISLISPVLPDLRATFGVSDAQVGLVITAYTLPGIFLTPFVGLVADRLGRRRVIVPLLLLFGVAGAGVSLADTFLQVVALRFLQGVGGSALIALAVTLIGDFYDGGHQDRIIGLNASTIGVGAAFYPLVGGGLASIRWNAPFLFFGVAVLVGLYAAAVLEEPEFDQSTDVRTYLAGLREVMLLPRALAVFAVLVLVLFVFYGGVLTALPLLLADQFGLPAGRIGLLLAISSVATAIVSSQYGRIAAWRETSTLVALGFSAFGASFLGLWLAPSPIYVAAVMPGFGTGIGLMMPTIDKVLIGVGPRRFRAGVFGIRTSMLRVGQTLGPVGFTWFAESAFATPAQGYRVLLRAVGGGLLLIALGSYLLPRYRRVDGAAPAGDD